jgi:threonine/homoserine/homoserine lactone efflux protein
VLSAANPKALLVCIAAGATIAAGDVEGAQTVWSVVGFTVVAASTVAVPVLAFAVSGGRMTAALDSLRRWLIVRGAVVTSTLLAAIGLVLIGQGMGGLV